MPESKKIIVKLDVHDNKCKRKALKKVSGLNGIESLSMDMKDQKLTVVGDVDPVCIVCKLKKWNPEIVSVGPAKDEKKEAEEKKKKEAEEKKKKKEEEACKKMLESYWRYNYPCMPPQYCVRPVDDCPGGCVIC